MVKDALRNYENSESNVKRRACKLVLTQRDRTVDRVRRKCRTSGCNEASRQGSCLLSLQFPRVIGILGQASMAGPCETIDVRSLFQASERGYGTTWAGVVWP